MKRQSYKWGNGNCATVLTEKELSIKRERILPDSGEPWHFHKATHQWFLALSGDLMIETQSGRHFLKENECISVPPLVAHKVWNVSTNPVEFYLISSNSDGNDKFILEYQFQPLTELQFQCTPYSIRSLKNDENQLIRELSIENEQVLSKRLSNNSKHPQAAPTNVMSLTSEQPIHVFGIFLGRELKGYISIEELIRVSNTCRIDFWLDQTDQKIGIISEILRQFILQSSLNFGLKRFMVKPPPLWNPEIRDSLGMVGFKKGGKEYQHNYVMNAKTIVQNHDTIRVLRHSPKRSHPFKELNEEWIDELFAIEDSDTSILNNPEDYIINSGGEIFYLEFLGEIVSTGAIMRLRSGEFELTKMATRKKYQGLGFGDLVIQEAIKWSKEKSIPYLILFTQSSLFKALNLYEKHGFRYESLTSSTYTRADVKMKLEL